MRKMLNTKAFEQWLKMQGENAIRYRQIEKSDILAEYNTLKKVVDSTEFQNKKNLLTNTRYADTEEGKTMAKYKQLKHTSAVFFYNLLKREAWKAKAEVAEYLALEEHIQTPEFQQSHAFWKNAKRWFTTNESKQEDRYNQLAKHADILFFMAHTEDEIAELESYKTLWTEDFDCSTLSNVWKTGFLYPSTTLQANHSHVSELQAYTKGNNTKISASELSIITKKQKITAPAWHPTKGMVMQEFAYTSDVWHTIDAITSKAGVLQAKVCVSGKVKHVMSLTTPQAKTSLAVLHTENALKGYAIYTLVWNDKEVIAYVNNIEVERQQNTLAGQALHLVLRSYLPENQKAGSGQMLVDWIRVYSK